MQKEGITQKEVFTQNIERAQKDVKDRYNTKTKGLNTRVIKGIANDGSVTFHK